jgi:hypothetical protein
MRATLQDLNSRIYKVYKYTFSNGKKYLGITSQDMKGRKSSSYHGNRSMQEEITRCGWQAVIVDIIAENLSREQALILEKTIIMNENLQDPAVGYNQSPKAVFQFSFDGRLITQYFSVTDASKETGFSIASIGKCCIGDTKSAHGYLWRYQTTMKEFGTIYEYDVHYKTSAVVQCDTEWNVLNVWESIILASNTLGIAYSSISGICCGSSKAVTAGGYKWRYITIEDLKQYEVLTADGMREFKNKGVLK